LIFRLTHTLYCAKVKQIKAKGKAIVKKQNAAVMMMGMLMRMMNAPFSDAFSN